MIFNFENMLFENGSAKFNLVCDIRNAFHLKSFVWSKLIVLLVIIACLLIVCLPFVLIDLNSSKVKHVIFFLETRWTFVVFFSLSYPCISD